MPSANRFVFMRQTVRSHPFLIASWAAMGGILLGGFVTLKMLQPEPRAAKVGPAQVVAEARLAPKPVAETTGSAPAGDSASADCDHQTWPNLSRACMEAMQAKNRAPRVISTDKLDKPSVSAIEAPAPSPAASQPPPATPAPVTAETTPVTSPAPTNPAPAPAVVAAPQSPPGALVGTAQAEEKSPQPADQKEAKQEKHERVAKKAKRKPKVEPKAQPRDESNDDDDHVANAEDQATVSNPSDDRIAGGRADRRRIVERRPAREYNVPAEDGSGDRRVMVIRRDNGGGIFGNLFGGFGD